MGETICVRGSKTCSHFSILRGSDEMALVSLAEALVFTAEGQ